MAIADNPEQVSKRLRAHMDPAEPACGGKPCHEPLALKYDACEVLNGDKALDAVLGKPDAAPAEALKSDCDEQLLVTLTLATAAKVHSIHIAGADTETAPKTVKLFLNKTNLDFSDVEGMVATQTLTLGAGAQTVPLQFVKFQNVSSLAVFIEDNQGGGEVTSLSKIELIGTPLSTTNMNDLKKGG